MFSIGLQSGDSAGVLHQLMPLSLKNCAANLGVIRIVVLHKTVWIRINLIQKGLQRIPQDLNTDCIHLAFKDAHTCPPSQANASLHMHFDWVLGSVVWKWKESMDTYTHCTIVLALVCSRHYLELYCCLLSHRLIILQRLSLPGFGLGRLPTLPTTEATMAL